MLDYTAERKAIDAALAITKEFERLFSVLQAKRARVDELKALGRYGYQLRMPKVAVRIAARKLKEFCQANDISLEGIL